MEYKKQNQTRLIVQAILVILVIFGMANAYAQNDTIRGSIKYVDYTQDDGVHITIENGESGQLIDLKTNEYIRKQKEFFIENGENILPPPLHVTDVWTEDNIIYFTTSEPVRDLVIYLREYRWDGYIPTGEHTQYEWASQSMTNSNGYVTTHSYGIPRKFLGINWSWQLVIAITNERGDIAESELFRFKTNGQMFEY